MASPPWSRISSRILPRVNFKPSAGGFLSGGVIFFEEHTSGKEDTVSPEVNSGVLTGGNFGKKTGKAF